MNERSMSFRQAALAPLTGVLMVIFLLMGIAVTGSAGYRPTAERALEYFTESADRIVAGHYFGMISVVFLLWFAGSLFKRLRQAEGQFGRLSMIAFAGAVFTSIALVMGFGLLGVGADLATSSSGLGPREAALVHRMYSKLMASTFSFGLVVLIGATGVATLRSQVFPAWFGWISLGMTILLVTPLHWLMEIAALPWIVLASIWMSQPQPAQVQPPQLATEAGALE